MPKHVSTPNLNALPDIAALRRVQSALWEAGDSNGAAIMVGAGFSQAATTASGDAAPMPLWRTFSVAMASTLYPEGGAPTDPLRLAQEYEAALGRHALDELIRTLVDDPARSPGALHKALLRLPWADILTTNWDTLLERAALDNPDRHYAPVLTTSDISRTKAPRIIKLHGTLPSHPPFIFTEEDFRRYPRKSAPFVNLTQQILMENVLCLVGFSGDDPNFLEWSGWVRDHLGASAATIYLVGALNLSQAKRKMLEARNVSPIDLSPVLGDIENDRHHQVAMEAFIESLHDARPWPKHRWPEKKSDDADYDLTDEERLAKAQERNNTPPTPAEIVQAWREERFSYPGWVVAPYSQREMTFHRTKFHHHEQPNFSAMDFDDRCMAVFEYGWRLELSLAPMPDAEVPHFEAAVTEASPLARKQKDEVKCWLLRHARENGDWNKFIGLASDLENSQDANLRAHSFWEQSLWSRDYFDFSGLEKKLPFIVGDDPIWKLRQAHMLTFLRREAEAFELVRLALRELRIRQAQDRHSIWLASRVAWAMYMFMHPARFGDFKVPKDELLDVLDEQWPARLTTIGCNPWDELRYVTDGLKKEIKSDSTELVEIKPSFDPGYSSRVERMAGRDSSVEPSRARRFLDAAGIPNSLGYFSIAGDIPALVVEAGGVNTVQSIIHLTQIRGSTDLSEKVLSRLRVARLDIGMVEETVKILRVAIADALRRAERASMAEKNWRETQSWSSVAARAVENMSRLVVRLTEAMITAVLIDAFEIASSARGIDWGFYKPLGHLLERCLHSLSKEKAAEFLLHSIEMAVPGEKSKRREPEHDWPEVIFEFQRSGAFLARPSGDVRWSNRIAQLIELARTPAALSRERAIQRLSQLYNWKLLTDLESASFANALWAHRAPGHSLPENTGLLAHVMLSLPEPEPGIALKCFKLYMTLPSQGLGAVDKAVALYNATRYSPPPNRFSLSSGEAVEWYNRALHPRTVKRRGRGGYDDDYFEDQLRWALAGAIVPAIESSEFTSEMVSAALNSLSPALILTALPAILVKRPDAREQIEERLRRGLGAIDSRVWISSANAVLEWVSYTEQGVLDEPPKDIISEIAKAVLDRKADTLLIALRVSRSLGEKQMLGAADLDTLSAGLAYLLGELSYQGSDAEDTAHISLLRASCAKLAVMLHGKGIVQKAVAEWLEEAKVDPLPEVRNAILA